MDWHKRASAAAAALALSVLAAPAPAQIAADAPSSPGEAAHTLRDLVGRYLAFRGGATYEALQSIHERLYLETSAAQRPGALWLDRDGRMRREAGGGGSADVEVATAEGAWRTAADGKVVDDPGAYERSRRWALIEFGDAFTGRGGAQVALAGSAEVGDETWSVVRITFGDADVYDALIDPVTGGLCCYRITEGGVQRLLKLGGWRLVDGVRMPFMQITDAGGETGSRVTAIELNRPVDATLFQKPTGGG